MYKTNYGVYYDKLIGNTGDYLSYADVVEREIRNLILFNDITSLCEDDYSIYDGLEEDEDVFQWYLTDCDKFDVDYINEHYPNTLDLVYCNTLDMYVLRVNHFGTSWKYVPTDIKIAKVAE